MVHNGHCLLLVASIASSGAFHAPLLPCSGTSQHRAQCVLNGVAPVQQIVGRQSARRAPTRPAATSIPLSRVSDPASPVEFSRDHAFDIPPSSKMFGMLLLATLPIPFIACLLLEISLPFHFGMVPPAFWALLKHGFAGSLAGLAALLSDSALSASLTGSTEALKGLLRSVKFTAVTKAASSMTYVAIQQGIATLSLGWTGIVLAAAGTGVVATIVQGAFAGSRPDFFRDNVAKNVVMFEAFWLTYAALSLLSPVCSITYLGLAISGTISGLASSMAASIKFRPLRGVARAAKHSIRRGLKTVRRFFSTEQMPSPSDVRAGQGVVTRANVAVAAFFDNVAHVSSHWRPAVSTGVLNVCYMAVFWSFD